MSSKDGPGPIAPAVIEVEKSENIFLFIPNIIGMLLLFV